MQPAMSTSKKDLNKELEGFIVSSVVAFLQFYFFQFLVSLSVRFCHV